MASIPNPLGAVKNFAQAFRAAKKGKSIRRILPPAGPELTRTYSHTGLQSHQYENPFKPIGKSHPPLGMKYHPKVEAAMTELDKTFVPYRKRQRLEKVLATTTHYVPIKPARVNISAAEHYGEILGQGFSKPATQRNLFRKVNPEGLDKARRTQAFRKLKKAVVTDIGKARTEIRDAKINARLSLKMGVAQAKWSVRRKLPGGGVYGPRFLLRRAKNEFLRGRDYVRRGDRGLNYPHFSTDSYGHRFRYRTSFAERLGAYSAAPLRAFHITPERVDKIRATGQKAAGKYDAVAAKVNRIAARRIPFREKVTLKEVVSTPTHSEMTGAVSQSRYQMRASRNPVLGFGFDVEQYGRQGNLRGPMDLSLPGRSTLHTNAPMRQRIGNLRQAFSELRKRHPGVHDWTLEKAIPKSRSVRELERMVGENAPTMKLRKLRYTRPDKPR